MSTADAARALMALDWVRARLIAQDGIPTSYDNALAGLANAILECADSTRQATLHAQLEKLMTVCFYTAGRRMWPLAERLQTVGARRDIAPRSYACGQGVQTPLQWHGRSLFKNVWDLALYQQLIAELNPATIIELGSGSGASAWWLADMAALASGPCRVLSFDIQPPNVIAPRVEFLYCDLSEPGLARLAVELDADLPRPWLVIEDAHVNTLMIIEFFADELISGDFLVIEDSPIKQAALARFADTRGEAFLVDGKYTDMFGTNATSAMNSVLVRA